MTSFLDDLPGIRDVQYMDGPVLPRRSVLNIRGDGIVVTDNTALGTTDITVPGVGVGLAFTAMQINASTNNYVPTGVDTDGQAVTEQNLIRYSMHRWSADATRNVTGLTTACMPQLIVVNAGSFPINLQHESLSSQPECRFLCPMSAQYQLLGGRAVNVIRDPISNRWRVVL